MTSPFIAHGQATWRWTSVGAAGRRRARRAAAARREQLAAACTRLATRVVGGQELREHVAAADGAGEDDAVLGRGPRQVGERRRRPHDLEPLSFDEPSTWLVTVIGTATLPVVPFAPSRRRNSSSVCSTGISLPVLVDQEEALGGAVEDGAEVGADGGHEPLRVADRLREPARGLAPSAKNPCADTASTPSGPTTSGSTNEAAE